jgi:hypothetical protein
VGTVTFNDLNPTDVISGYTITAGNTGAVFAINPVSGQLSVAKSGLLNASATPSCLLTIQATDNATPPYYIIPQGEETTESRASQWSIGVGEHGQIFPLTAISLACLLTSFALH